MKAIRVISRLKIAQKLPLYIVGAGFAVGLTIGVSTYFNAAASLEEARRDQLVTALQARKTALESYFAGVEQDLRIVATSRDDALGVDGIRRRLERIGGRV